MKHANENIDPWQTLSLATERLLTQLHKHQNETSAHDGNADQAGQRDNADHGRQIDHPLNKQRALNGERLKFAQQN